MSKPKCIWTDGKTYRGKSGGIREVIEQDEHTVTVLDVKCANGYRPGGVLTISRESMKRWCHSDSKQIGGRS